VGRSGGSTTGWPGTAHYARLRPGLSADQVAALERYVGYRFPTTLRCLYRWRDGQEPDSEPFRGGSHLLSAAEVRSAWTMLTGYVDDGTFDRPQWWDRGWVPFLGNPTGSHLCVDLYGSFTGRRGQVLAFWPHDADRPVVAPSLAAWLRHFVAQLEAGRWRLNADTGAFEYAGRRKPAIPGYPIYGNATEELRSTRRGK
jgi:cell wall assembly regulator SMI1